MNKRIKFKRHVIKNRQNVKVIDFETDIIIMEVPQLKLVNLSAKIYIFVGIMMDRLS